MTSCLGCGAPGALRFVTRSGHRVRRCEGCDLEFVEELPTPEQLAAVYERDYFAGEGHGYGDYFGAQRAEADAKARARLDLLARLGAHGPALDLGCADGRFVLAARGRGLDAHGVELSSEARAHADPSITARVHATLDAARPHGPFALVTAWDVLEHLPDPSQTLRALREVTAPDALVAAVTPVIDNVTARRAPRWWDQYKPPEHLWFFSRRSLRALLCDALGADPVHEEVAWERPARVCDGFAPLARRRGQPVRALRALEGSLWSLAKRAHLARADYATDSALVVVRKRP